MRMIERMDSHASKLNHLLTIYHFTNDPDRHSDRIALLDLAHAKHDCGLFECKDRPRYTFQLSEFDEKGCCYLTVCQTHFETIGRYMEDKTMPLDNAAIPSLEELCNNILQRPAR